jgi:hypothetical protein
MGSKVIIGWDLGASGEPAELPCKPREILLFPALNETQAPSFGVGPNLATVDVWGLDPRLDLTVAFYQRLRTDGQYTSGGPRTRADITATIEAWTLARADGPSSVVEVAQIASADLFANGGNLQDGCELSTGAQGVRFKIFASRSSNTDYDVVCSIQARAQMPLGCEALAEKIIHALSVEPTAGQLMY